MMKRILIAVLIVVMTIVFLPTVTFADTATSGTCGESLTWSFDTATGTLTIDGTGKMTDYESAYVNREQMCVMLVNFKKIEHKKVENKSEFADDAKIASWAKDEVYICQMADIVNGKGENKFDPKGTGTRAEASVIFTKFHKEISK